MHLSRRELNHAFPLMQATGTAFTPSSWRTHASRWVAADPDERGIVGLRGGWSVLFSLFFYEVKGALPRGCLSVPELHMVDLGSRRHVAKVTLQAIDEVAHACRCDRVRLHVAGDGHAGVELVAAVEPADCGYAVAADGNAWLRCLHFS
ncbi:MAG: hypothetical protein U1E14_17030 [Geminicoccaceae bacterium]